jgi:tetratricopeptide (TPR) repeat protein
MTRRTGLAIALIAAMHSAGCTSHSSSSVAAGPADIAVPDASLWDPNAPKDPVVEYRLRIAMEPENPALHNNLGNLYVLRNWMPEAVQAYKRTIELDPSSPVAWNNLGTAYLKMGKTGDALSAFEKSVKLDSHYALGWYNIGVAYDEQGKYDEAIDNYLKAASLNPNILSVKENPQAVANRRLVAVRLRHFLEEQGNLALPLESMPE